MGGLFSATDPRVTNAGKVVLITGTSSGMGKEAVLKFQDAGWTVVATMRDPKKSEFSDLENVDVMPLDVTKKTTIQEAVRKTIKKYGQIDALINNAAYGSFGFLEETSDEEVNRTINTNVVGVIDCIKEVVPHMRNQKKGIIISITSVGGLVGLPMCTLYHASKFALEGLHESLQFELAPFGIHVKTLAPGAFKTKFIDNVQLFQGNMKDDLKEHRETYFSWFAVASRKLPPPFKFADPKEVGEKLYAMCMSPTSYGLTTVVGKDAKIMQFMLGFFGKSIVWNMNRKNLFPNSPLFSSQLK